MRLGDVDERRVQAGDVDRRVTALGGFRHDVVPQAMDELRRRLVLRRRVRGDEDDRDGLRVVELRLPDGCDVLEPADTVVDPLRGSRIALDVDDDRDRAVEARPEPLGEEVVRATRGLVGRLRSLIRRSESHKRRGPGEQETDREQDPEHRLRVGGYELTPACDERVLARGLGVVDRLQERHFQAVDLVSELRQHGDEQRVRDQHGREDAERRADSELRDEVEAEEREAGHRDRHRQTGEDHRSTRRGSRLRRRVARRQALVQVLPEARDDEERVVDPDADPDHRDEDRRDRVDVGQPGEDEEQDERRSRRPRWRARSGSRSRRACGRRSGAR